MNPSMIRALFGAAIFTLLSTPAPLKAQGAKPSSGNATILVLDPSSASAGPGQTGQEQDAVPLVRATFRIPGTFPETLLSWSAVPLDPDMSPEAWAPQTDSWIAEGEFEPGRYEVSTVGPGEVEFCAVVHIVPGQSNDFVIPVADGE